MLDAVVALLAEGNPKVVENTFSGDVPSGDRIRVLIQILATLMEREQGKTAATIEELGLRPAEAYTPEEQAAWLASDLLGAREPELGWCGVEARGDYVKRIKEFLRDHPFRTENEWASPVFSAYIVASRFGDVRIRRSISDVGTQTGLLFDFVTALDAAADIDEWQFAALHASMLAAEWQAVEADVSLEPGTESETPEAVAGDLMLLEAGEVRRTSFEMTLEVPGTLNLLGPTAYLSAAFPGTVSIPGSGSLTLGPECFISCDAFRVAADTIEVARRARWHSGDTNDDPSVTLEVRDSWEVLGTLLGSPGSDLLEIRTGPEISLVYPWVTYDGELAVGSPAANERAERLLKMFMALVRRHGHAGRMAVFDKKLQGRQSVKGGEFTAAIRALEELGIVSYEGELIYLQSDWEQHWFSGRDRPGLPGLDDKREVFADALRRMSERLSS